MEFPLVFNLGPFSIQAHLIFELLAFGLGFRYFQHLRKGQTDQISTQNRIWIIIGAAAGALIGSRLLGALESPSTFFGGQVSWLYFYQSKTIIGGLLGGLIGVESIKRFIGEKQSSGDLFTFPLILGMMIGRIGCFSAGVSELTYGLASNLPWAMDLGDGIPRHPTALYEIIFLLFIWIGLYLLEKKVQLVSGARFKIFMTAYLLYRFGVSFIQPGEIALFGLKTIQLACIAGLIYYWKVWLQPKSNLYYDLLHHPPSINHRKP